MKQNLYTCQQLQEKSTFNTFIDYYVHFLSNIKFIMYQIENLIILIDRDTHSDIFP